MKRGALKRTYKRTFRNSNESRFRPAHRTLVTHAAIRLAIGDTPAVENYPELGETLGGSALHQYEYGEHDAAVAAVRAVTRSA